MAALRDNAAEVRAAAAGVLGRSGNTSVIGELAISLKDPDLSVRRAAAGALRGLGWRPSTREEAAWFDIALGNTRATVSAQGIPMESEPEPESQTSFHRRMAAAAHREKHDPARISALLTAAGSHDLLAQISAIHDLGEVPDPIVSSELVRFISHPEKEVRLATAQALARRNDTQPAHFMGLLKDSSSEVRLVAVQFFARVPNQQITAVLLPLLSDPLPAIREAAATAVGAIGDSVAIEELVLALVDENQRVCEAAYQSLQQLDPNWQLSDGALAARPRLESLLSFRHESDFDRIQQLLQSISPRESFAADGGSGGYSDYAQ